MYCKNCGNLLGENNRFCSKCGAKVEALEKAEANNVEVNTESQTAVDDSYIQAMVDNSSVQETDEIDISQSAIDNIIEQQVVDADIETPVADSVDGQSVVDTDDELHVVENNFEQRTVESNVVPQYVDNSVIQSAYQQEQVRACVVNDVPKKKDAKSTISLILGLISTVLSFIINVLVFPVAIVGFILGLASKCKGGKKTAGIILNIVAMVLSVSILVGICVLAVNSSGSNTETYYGDGYTLEYNSKWSVVTMDGGQEGLQYKSQDSYFVPIGKSALSDYEGDFEFSTVQSNMYGEFYDYWSEELNDKSLYLYEDEEFDLLKDDIYYATYNYGKSEDDLRGKYYLVVSTYDNAVLSFMTNTCDDKVEKMDDLALELLESIYIYYIEEATEAPTEPPTEEASENVIYDDDMYDILDSMRNWNRYSELRSGELGKEANLVGGWRILSDSEQYWKFEKDKFWWYQSVNELDDNYWHGTAQIFTGKKGLALAGLDTDKVDTIINQSDGAVSDSDICTVVMTPTKIISGGEDKSATNIPEDTTWTYIWIIVDHGEEGIEAQVLNMQTYDALYFVKVED